MKEGFMMPSPKNYSDEIAEESFESLIKERDLLIREIRRFEKNREKIMADGVQICPSPELVYRMNLEYLGMCCMALAAKYNERICR